MGDIEVSDIKVRNGYKVGGEVVKMSAKNMLRNVSVKPGKKYIRVLHLCVGALPPEEVDGYVELVDKQMRASEPEGLYADTYVIPFRGEPLTKIEFYEVEE